MKLEHEVVHTHDDVDQNWKQHHLDEIRIVDRCEHIGKEAELTFFKKYVPHFEGDDYQRKESEKNGHGPHNPFLDKSVVKAF